MHIRPTAIVSIDPDHPESTALQRASRTIRSGGLVAFPTETVYGLGANAFNEESVRKIFEAKGRPSTNPVIIHVSDRTMLNVIVTEWPDFAEKLAAAFWPGPLTLVLPRSPKIPDIVTAGGPNVAVRMPAHPVSLGLIRECGCPLAAPSANRSSELSPTRAEHVLNGLAGRIDMILDAGPTPNGIESTVIDLSRHPPVLLRPGPISLAAIEAIIGAVERKSDHAVADVLSSPGLLPRHYAPRTAIELFTDRHELLRRAAELQSAGIRVGKLLVGGTDDSAVIMPADPAEYAARLYDELHTLDASSLGRILVERPPRSEDWLAVHDRLSRAAHPAG